MENEIIEYDVTNAALEELKAKFSIVPDNSTKEGYADIKSALKVITPYRTGVEAKRKELKADSLARGRLIDTEAKRITAAIVEIEQPYIAAKKEVDEAEAKAKQAVIDEAARKLAEEQAERDRLILEQEEKLRKLQEEVDAKQAVIDAEAAEKAREAREQQIAKDAAENAKKEAEQASAKREQELKAAAERAEREAKETEERVKREAVELKKKEEAEAVAREANKKHKASINNAAVKAFVSGGMTQENAKKAVTLITGRKIPAVVISY